MNSQSLEHQSAFIDSVRESTAELDTSLSYRSGITTTQKRVFNRLAMTLGLFGLIQPSLFALAVSWVFVTLFALLIGWRLFLILVGTVLRLANASPSGPVEPEAELPVYTIVVAAYEEAPLMDQLAQALSQIDWPSGRLDVLLLLEADDVLTQTAARQAAFPETTRILLVPPGGPRTKPNALNHGLKHARGAFLVVYDVEDLPAPDQLKHAFAEFERSGPETICLQARLAADNANASWLAAHWALEYDVQFGLLLPATALYQMPLLLGGTSNHFRQDALHEARGWDAWNVTEDADLGMRLARARTRVRTLSSTTLEDAPVDLDVWLPQRGRWIKGYLQTWLVLMRRPSQTRKELGFVGFCSVQLSLGGAIVGPLCHAPLFGMVLIAMATKQLEIGLAGTVLLSSGMLVSLIGDLCAPGKWSAMRVVAMLTQPLYWPLLSIAAYRAIWSLAKQPSFWAKTPHTPRGSELCPQCSTGSLAQDSPSP